jgi:hypothetical protein
VHRDREAKPFLVKKTAPVRARVCAVVVEDSRGPMGGWQRCTAVSNDLAKSLTNKYLFMDRHSWPILQFKQIELVKNFAFQAVIGKYREHAAAQRAAPAHR